MPPEDLRHRAVDDDDDARPLWDPALALALIGKRVLVGVTDLASDGAVLRQRQFHGYTVRAHWRDGIALRLSGPRAGEEIVLPADTRAFRPARTGDYRLRAAGEAVEGPDFLANWTRRARDTSRHH